MLVLGFYGGEGADESYDDALRADDDNDDHGYDKDGVDNDIKRA